MIIQVIDKSESKLEQEQHIWRIGYNILEQIRWCSEANWLVSEKKAKKASKFDRYPVYSEYVLYGLIKLPLM